MILRDSIGNILKELCIHDMPISVVITKCDKVTHSIIDEGFKNLKEKIKQYVGNVDIRYCFTSSNKGNAKELKQYLYEIQAQAQEILKNHYKPVVINATNNLENYLNMILKNNDLSESELDEKELVLKNELDKLDNCLEIEKDKFITQVDNCVEEIKMDVQMELQANENMFVSLLLNKQSIEENINYIIRNAVIKSIQNRFIPKFQKYLKKVANTCKIDTLQDFGVVGSEINMDAEGLGKKIGIAVAALVAAAVIGLPIIGAIVVGVVTIISAISDKIQGSKRREEAKLKIRQKLNIEVFPAIINQVGISVGNELNKQIESINANLQEEINLQRLQLEKAMNDLKSQKQLERENKESLIAGVKHNLEIIGEIKNEL